MKKILAYWLDFYQKYKPYMQVDLLMYVFLILFILFLFVFFS